MRPRRLAAFLLMLLGALLMFLATPTWMGVALLGMGVAIELFGLALGHAEPKDRGPVTSSAPEPDKPPPV